MPKNNYNDPLQLYQVNYTHTHFASYFGWNPTDGTPPPKTRHACLDVGNWCPEQYKEEQLDVVVKRSP